MADINRDELQGSESEIEKRPDELLFKSLRIIIVASICLLLTLLTIRIEYPMKWIFFGIIFCLSDTLVWIVSGVWLSQQQYPRIAKVILSIAQNSTLALLPIFVILLCLYLDDIVKSNPILIALPLFAWKIFLLSFLIFIIPGLCDDNYGSKKWVVVLILYYVAFIYTEVAALVQLQYQFNWFWVTSLLLFAMGYNIVVLISDCTVTITWPCIVLSVLIFCLAQFTNILNMLSIQEQPTNAIQYQTVLPLLAIGIINLINQIL